MVYIQLHLKFYHMHYHMLKNAVSVAAKVLDSNNSFFCNLLYTMVALIGIQLSFPVFALADSSVEEWRTCIAGSGISKNGLVAGDIDNDGLDELICASSNFWYVLDYKKDINEYRIVSISELSTKPITATGIMNRSVTGKPGVVVCYGNNGFSYPEQAEARLFENPLEKQTGRLFSINGSSCVRFADADNDGKTEIILCGQDIYLYDAYSLSLKKTIPYACSSLEIGNVDSDSLNEIVTDQALVLECHNDTCKLQWKWRVTDSNNPSKNLFQLCDIDNDKMMEVISYFDNYKQAFNVYDVDLQAKKMDSIPLVRIVEKMVGKDIDGDGSSEVFYADDQWGNLHCRSTIHLNEVWTMRYPGWGMNSLIIAATRTTGSYELIAAPNSSTDSGLIILGPLSTTTDSSPEILQAFVAAKEPFKILKNIYNDEPGCINGILTNVQDFTVGILDRSDPHKRTCIPLYSSPDEKYQLSALLDLCVTDINYDGVDDVIALLLDHSNYLKVKRIDGKTLKVDEISQRRNVSPDNALKIFVNDINGDKNWEIITYTPKGIEEYSESTGSLLWRYSTIDNRWTISQLYLVEVNNDQIKDFAGIGRVSDVYPPVCSLFTIDGKTCQIRQTKSNDELTASEIGDVDDDGFQEIIAGTSKGQIVVFDLVTHNEKFRTTASFSPISFLCWLRKEKLIVFVNKESICLFSLKDRKPLSVIPYSGSVSAITVDTECDSASSSVLVNMDKMLLKLNITNSTGTTYVPSSYRLTPSGNNFIKNVVCGNKTLLNRNLYDLSGRYVRKTAQGVYVNKRHNATEK